jgi:hypothetical protein
LRQAPAPSHFPSSPQLLAREGGQSDAARGSEPAALATQVPSEPVRAQVRQPPPQDSLQQNPSTQKLLAQSAAQPHGWPFAFAAPPSGRLHPASPAVGRSVAWSVAGR